ncbi:S1 family peptidase [Sphingomonas sp.]|uniref:S1 family peptidase n=1 Tax=Sphingomonas sp. TaxID=28214 RepID=UPI003D6D3D17
MKNWLARLLADRRGVAVPLFIGLISSIAWAVPAHAQRSERQIVTIYGELGSKRVSLGSGFVVAGGVVATAYHVVEGATTIEIAVPGTVPLIRAAAIRAIAPRQDLALLTVPALRSVVPLQLRLTLPTIDTGLKMVGAAAGIAGSTYRASLAHAKPIPLTSFADGQGRPFYPNMGDIQVLHIGGIIYNGLSGGALLDADGAALGLICGSLNIGGAAGWAIPSAAIRRLLAQPDLARPIAGFAWPRGLRSGAARSLAYVRTLDPGVAATVDDFTALANRLAEVNRQVGLKMFWATSSLSSFSSAVSAHRSSARILANGPIPWPVERLNDSLADRDPQTLRDVRVLLVERFSLDRRLRAAVARLDQAAANPALDETSAARIRQTAEQIKRSQPDIATTTFEVLKGIDRSQMLQSLDTLAAHLGGPFQDSGAALVYARRADRLRDQLEQYGLVNDWFFHEQAYYSEAAAFIRRYRGVVVFVPER